MKKALTALVVSVFFILIAQLPAFLIILLSIVIALTVDFNIELTFDKFKQEIKDLFKK